MQEMYEKYFVISTQICSTRQLQDHFHCNCHYHPSLNHCLLSQFRRLNQFPYRRFLGFPPHFCLNSFDMRKDPCIPNLKQNIDIDLSHNSFSYMHI